MKIVVLGKGFLGTEFERQGYEVLGKDKFIVTDPNSLLKQLHNLKDYDVIINCIGKCNTRWCENNDNFNEALYINGITPGYMSKFCEDNNIKFVHISTGCLYDNDDRSVQNKESDFIAAHCNYTVTKWVGEMNCGPDDLILRPRLLFSDVESPNNLLQKIDNFTTFVSNKYDSLTSTKTIVEATNALLEANQTGIFNVANEGYASMFKIAEWCGLLNKPNITSTTIDEVRKTNKLYLVNNVMDISKLEQFYSPTTLEIEIKRCYNSLHEKSHLQENMD